MERKRLRPGGTAKRRGYPAQILDSNLCTQFMRLIREGLPADGVCDYLGVGNRFFHAWYRNGETYVQGGNTPKELAPYGKFYREFRKACAAYRLDVLRRLHLGKKNWTCWMAILERRDRPNFSRFDQGGGDYQDFDPDESFL